MKIVLDKAITSEYNNKRKEHTHIDIHISVYT